MGFPGQRKHADVEKAFDAGVCRGEVELTEEALLGVLGLFEAGIDGEAIIEWILRGVSEGTCIFEINIRKG